jgi:V-type H+-transporting ATPase subunit a
VETYGIHTYQEANPAVVSIITFPFLFGMMFGDIGHGSLILILGLVLVFSADSMKKSKDLKGFAMMRYIVLLMGFFATYCGFIYNEFFSLPLSLFPTCYETQQDIWNPGLDEKAEEIEGEYVFYRYSPECTSMVG